MKFRLQTGESFAQLYAPFAGALNVGVVLCVPHVVSMTGRVCLPLSGSVEIASAATIG